MSASDLLDAGSFVLAGINLLNMWLLSAGRRLAWVSVIVAQSLWAPYNIVTGQYGFLVLGAVTVVVACRGLKGGSR